MWRDLSRLSLVLLLCGFAGQVLAQATSRNVLNKVDVAAVGDQITVRMNFAEPLKALPAGFSVANPNRIVLDFPLTDNGLQSQDLSTSRGYLKNLRVAQTDARLRLVLNLDRQATYQSRLDGVDLVLTLLAIDAAPLAKKDADAQFQSVAPIERLVGVREVSFRRGVLGEGRVVVDLDDPSVGVDVKKQGNALLVEFSNASAPDALLRKLDVTDFGTPVASISTSRTASDRVRIEVRQANASNWDHLAYQTDTQFVLEVKPVVEDVTKLGGGVGRFTGERMSLRFREYPVREVLQAFSDFSSFNMVISDAVSGTITLNLQDVPWDQAMDIILKQKNLAMDRQGNVIMIAPKDELIARAKANQEAVALEPVRDATFQLNFLSAGAAKKALEEYVSGFKNSKLRDGETIFIMAESNTNKLFVKAPESWIDVFARVIKEFDVPPRQVMIEARIVEAREGFTSNLGARIGYSSTRGFRGDTTPVGTVTPIGGAYDAVNNTDLQTDGGFNVALPSAGGALNFLLANAAQTRLLNLELRALAIDGNGKEISSPRVMATNGQQAKIEDGTEIPYLQATSSGATSVAFKKATLSLTVTPTINADGRIAMDIQVNKDTPGGSVAAGEGSAVSINTKQVQTKVVVDNGGTVIIGGIYVESLANDTTGVPFLQDIPVVGWLFKFKSKVQARRELLVFITPRVVNDQMAIN
jgi:type IV pilus assembly protein PilQ